MIGDLEHIIGNDVAVYRRNVDKNVIISVVIQKGSCYADDGGSYRLTDPSDIRFREHYGWDRYCLENSKMKYRVGDFSGSQSKELLEIAVKDRRGFEEWITLKMQNPFINPNSYPVRVNSNDPLFIYQDFLPHADFYVWCSAPNSAKRILMYKDIRGLQYKYLDSIQMPRHYRVKKNKEGGIDVISPTQREPVFILKKPTMWAGFSDPAGKDKHGFCLEEVVYSGNDVRYRIHERDVIRGLNSDGKLRVRIEKVLGKEALAWARKMFLLGADYICVDPTTTLQPDGSLLADTWIRQNLSSDDTTGKALDNYGESIGMSVGRDKWAASRKCRGLMKWDFSSLPSGLTITDAKLQMKIRDKSQSYDTDYSYVKIYEVINDWIEGTTNSPALTGEVCWKQRKYNQVNWNSYGCGGAGTDYVNTVLAETTNVLISTLSVETWRDFIYNANGRTAIQNAVEGTDLQNGLLLKDNDEGSYADNAIQYYSSDYGTATDRPKHVITYTLYSDISVYSNRSNGDTYDDQLVEESGSAQSYVPAIYQIRWGITDADGLGHGETVGLVDDIIPQYRIYNGSSWGSWIEPTWPAKWYTDVTLQTVVTDFGASGDFYTYITVDFGSSYGSGYKIQLRRKIKNTGGGTVYVEGDIYHLRLDKTNPSVSGLVVYIDDTKSNQWGSGWRNVNQPNFNWNGSDTYSGLNGFSLILVPPDGDDTYTPDTDTVDDAGGEFSSNTEYSIAVDGIPPSGDGNYGS